MSQHYLVKCSCGTVLRQCRCIGPRTETIIPNGCDNCHKLEEINVVYKPKGLSGIRDVWVITKKGQLPIEFTREEFNHVHGIIHDHYHGDD